jgi:hypothetical protein
MYRIKQRALSIEHQISDPDEPAPAGTVASRRSNTFHVSMRCFDAQRINPQNLVRGQR